MLDLRGPVAGGLLAAAAVVLLAGWAVRRLAGPVFAHELTVLARRGYQPRLRAGLVAGLLGVLLLLYAGQFGWDAVAGRTPDIDPRTSRFGERFAVTVLAVQLVAVMVLTPAVVGSAVTEERDRGTLDLLRTTALTDREIVTGKLLARLAVVGGVVAAGLPVLALALLFGGVDPTRLLAGYAVTAGTGFGLGAASLYLGTVKDSLRGVLGTVYGGLAGLTVLGTMCWLVPGLAGVSPPSALFVSLFEPDAFRMRAGTLWWHQRAWPLVFGLVYGGGGLWLAWLAMAHVRTASVRRSDDSAAVRAGRRTFFVRPLGDDADPLVWQEREFGGRRFGGGGFWFGCGAFVLFAFGAALFVGVAQSVERGQWIAAAVARAVAPLVAVAAGAIPLALGVRVAGAVGRERERQTLDALLLLPGRPADVLRAKAVAAVQWAGWGLGLVGGAVGLAVLVGGFGVGAAVWMVAHLVAGAALAVGAAGFLSVRTATGSRATVLFLLGLLTLVVAPLLAGPLADFAGDGVGDFVRRLSPPAAVWRPGVSVAELGIAAGYAAVGWLLWRAAGRRLDRGERPV